MHIASPRQIAPSQPKPDTPDSRRWRRLEIVKPERARPLQSDIEYVSLRSVLAANGETITYAKRVTKTGDGAAYYVHIDLPSGKERKIELAQGLTGVREYFISPADAAYLRAQHREMANYTTISEINARLAANGISPITKDFRQGNTVTIGGLEHFAYQVVDEKGRVANLPMIKIGNSYLFRNEDADFLATHETTKTQNYTLATELAKRVSTNQTTVVRWIRNGTVEGAVCKKYAYVAKKDAERIELEYKQRAKQLPLKPVRLSDALKKAGLPQSTFQEYISADDGGKYAAYETIDGGAVVTKRIALTCGRDGRFYYLSAEDAAYILKHEQHNKTWVSVEEYCKIAGISENTFDSMLDRTNGTVRYNFAPHLPFGSEYLYFRGKNRVNPDSIAKLQKLIAWVGNTAVPLDRVLNADAILTQHMHEDPQRPGFGMIFLTETITGVDQSLQPIMEDIYGLGVRYATLPSTGNEQPRTIISMDDFALIDFHVALLDEKFRAGRYVASLMQKERDEATFTWRDRSMMWSARFIEMELLDQRGVLAQLFEYDRVRARGYNEKWEQLYSEPIPKRNSTARFMDPQVRRKQLERLLAQIGHTLD